MHPFRQLILVSLGRADSLEKPLSDHGWHAMINMARQQTMLGVLFDGVARLPQEQLPPEGIYENWASLTERIAGIYERHLQRTQELEKILSSLGLHACILKGICMSRLYPVPERRICGDIDVWVQGTHKKILRAFRKGGYQTSEILYQECKVDLFPDTTVDIHFHPSKMYNPFLNARLQRCLEELSPIRDDKALCYPDGLFNAVFCMAHMYRHYLEGGLGMRQMLDYYYLLRQLTPEERVEAMSRLRKLGMKRFTAAMMMSLRFNFQLEDEYLLCEPNRKLGKKLVKDMITMGNFGVMDKRNIAWKGEGRLGRFFRKNLRVFSYIGYYPREVLWAPFARITQFVWRLFRGYL